IRGGRAFQSLADFLRYDLGLFGTKVVCAEGDCGSCSVFLGRADANRINYKTVCSCIQFLYQLDCTHIVTIEGLKYDGKLNPVQEAMVTCQGTQCGFCTPGFIVSMYSMFQGAERERVTQRDVQTACIGNLCRCTGYEAILCAGTSVEGSQVKPLAELYPEVSFAELHERMSDPVSAESAQKRFFKPATVEEACRFR